MEEFKFKEIVDRLSRKKKFIFITILLFLALGLLFIFFTQKEFTASLKILPENQAGNRGIMSQISAIPGLNLGNQNVQENVLSSDLYPEIIQSNDFYLTLLNSRIAFGEDSMVVREYVSSAYSPTLMENIKKYTIGLPGLFRNAGNSLEESRIENGLTYIAGNDGKYIGWLNKRIEVETDNATKILTVGMESPNQAFSAQVANLTVNYLKAYLDDYQTQNDVRHLNFIEERKIEARKNYLNAQHELATFRDRNRNVLSEVTRTREEVLVQEFNLSSKIFGSLSEQYEQANIKSKEKRVVFKILERVQLPASQTKPQSVLILIVFTLTGMIFSLIYVLFPIIFKEFYE